MATEAAEERLKQLESLFSYGGKEKGSYSVETLLDVLLLLYDECCNSTLRRDKNVSEFIEHGKDFIPLRREVLFCALTETFVDLFSVKPVATKIKELRLRRGDFDPLNLIGKGAFGEVHV